MRQLGHSRFEVCVLGLGVYYQETRYKLFIYTVSVLLSP